MLNLTGKFLVVFQSRSRASQVTDMEIAKRDLCRLYNEQAQLRERAEYALNRGSLLRGSGEQREISDLLAQTSRQLNVVTELIAECNSKSNKLTVEGPSCRTDAAVQKASKRSLQVSPGIHGGT